MTNLPEIKLLYELTPPTSSTNSQFLIKTSWHILYEDYTRDLTIQVPYGSISEHLHEVFFLNELSLEFGGAGLRMLKELLQKLKLNSRYTWLRDMKSGEFYIKPNGLANIQVNIVRDSKKQFFTNFSKEHSCWVSENVKSNYLNYPLFPQSKYAAVEAGLKKLDQDFSIINERQKINDNIQEVSSVLSKSKKQSKL